MAEEPKGPKAPEEKKDAPKGDAKPKESGDEKSKKFALEVLVVCLILFALSRVLLYLGDGTFSLEKIVQSINDSVVGIYIRGIIIGYITIANILSLLFLVLMVYALIKVRQLLRIWEKNLYPEHIEVSVVAEKNERWQRVLEHSATENPSDWRLAVLEADIILDEMLDQEGYVGDTIGDKLKKAHRGEFRTLDQAWEAHRIRNAIAHEGQDFELTQRETRRILGLYEQVFREFEVI